MCDDGWLTEFESSGILQQVAVIKGHSGHYRLTTGEKQGNSGLITEPIVTSLFITVCLHWIILKTAEAPVLRTEVFVV